MRKTILILASLTLFFLLYPSKTLASGEAELQGDANIINVEGALTFEDNNSSVTINTETGNITGYAWSEDLGWIDFDNNGEEDSVKIDLETGSISGLAYVLNTGGQIDFSNFDSDVSIDISTGEAAGYAWSEDLGWIDFANVSLPNSSSFLGLSNSLSSLAETGQNIILPLLFGFFIVTNLTTLLSKQKNNI